MRVLILGAGVTGLSTGCSLKLRGQRPTVIESSGAAGGAVRTREEGGFLAEAGPNSLQIPSAQVESFLKKTGAAARIVEPLPQAKRRYIVRGGRPVPVPASPLAGVASPLFSVRGKLRLAGEVFVAARGEDAAEESVADFATRRVGREFLDYALNPLVAGIYAGNPHELSVRHAFPRVWNLERHYGGLIRGAIKLKRERGRKGIPFKPRMASFEHGMQDLPRALAGYLGGEALHLGASLTSLTQNDHGRWQARWTGADGTEHAPPPFDAVVSTIPAYAQADLPLPAHLRRRLEPLREMPYPPVSTLVLGYRRQDVRHPLDGFGMLVPEVEQRKILGVLFSSSIFPGRAPAGHVTLTVFIGGSRQPELATDDPVAALHLAMPELKDLLGVTGEPVFRDFTYWSRAIPQYNIGHGRYLQLMNAFEAAAPGFYLAGNFRDGISVGQSIEAGLAAAHRANCTYADETP